MAKIRIHQLAKELGKTSKQLCEELRAQGIEAKSHMSSVDEAVANRLRSASDSAKVAPAPEQKTAGTTAPAKPQQPPREARTAGRPQPQRPAPKKPRSPLGQGREPGQGPSKARYVPKVKGPEPVKPAQKDARGQAPASRETPKPPPGKRVGPPPKRPPSRSPHLKPPKPLDRRYTPARPKGSDRLTGRDRSGARRKPKERPRPSELPTVKHRRSRDTGSDAVSEIKVTEGVTVKELSEKLKRKSKDVIRKLLGRGVLSTINQSLDPTLAVEIAEDFGVSAEIVSFEEELDHVAIVTDESGESGESVRRAPVVTFMGHVDHGKTSLLDTIRDTNVISTEDGGITQHIGAYRVEHDGKGIVFLDTPGHEAFTKMRARGAKVTDIVVLVVAADDGVMPQTVEAIDHARAAEAPIVVAINKIDKAGANPDRVKQQLSEKGILCEDWGGDVVTVNVSAKSKEGLEQLLEMLLLVSEMQELTAKPERPATGTVLEAKIDRGRGAVATILVQNGSLNASDSFVAGAAYGRIRAMFSDRGQKLTLAGPSTPVEILGLQGLPRAGDGFQVIPEDKKAKYIGSLRQTQMREKMLPKTSAMTLEQFFKKVEQDKVKELALVIKADVAGSEEALTGAIEKLMTDKVNIRIIHHGVGAISENDVLLASASRGVIIGFNVRPERKASELAEKEGIDIRLHSVIYDVTDEIEKAIEGLLVPEEKEVFLGRVEVRDTFKVPRAGTIAGSYVTEGKISRSSSVRLLRDNVVVFTGNVGSLRRFKDDVSEVAQGYECGVGLENYNDIKIGDVIEAFKIEKTKS